MVGTKVGETRANTTVSVSIFQKLLLPLASSDANIFQPSFHSLFHIFVLEIQKMKKIYFIADLAMLLLCLPNFVKAQHWYWAHDTVSVEEAGGAQVVAPDNFGNLYCAANGYLFKHNASSGAITWQKTLGGNAVMVDNKGFVYLFFSADSGRGFTLQTVDSSGDNVWQTGGTNFGGGTANFNVQWSFTLDNYGHIYIAGYFNSASMVVGSDTLTNLVDHYIASYIVKYDTAGNLIWANKLTSPAGTWAFDGLASAFSIATDPDGNLYMVGSCWSNTLNFGDTIVSLPSSEHNIYVAKVDSNFHLLWITANGMLNPIEYNFSVYQIGADAAGSAYVAGSYYEQDTLGNVPLNYVAGSQGMAFVAKYQTNSGNVLWVKTGGAGINYSMSPNIYSFVTNQTGTSFLEFPNYLPSFSFGDSSYSMSYGDTSDPLAVVGVDSSGNISCGFVLGGYTGDDGCGIGLDNRGDAYICGDFNDSLKFGDTVLYNTYSERYFVAKFSCDAPLFQGTTKQLPSLQLFPNPTNYSLTIKIANSEFSSVIIENLLGQILLEKPIESSEMSVNVADFPSGMYLITFKGANEHVVKKFVKQ